MILLAVRMVADVTETRNVIAAYLYLQKSPVKLIHFFKTVLPLFGKDFSDLLFSICVNVDG